MNQNILNAVRHVPHEELFADKGAFFGSIFGTLVHIFVADSIWFRRFEKFDNGHLLNDFTQFPKAKSLDDAIFHDFNSYANAREKLDGLIIQFIENLQDDDFSKELSYKNMKGVEFTKPLCEVLAHFFNHQTHHRGQISTLLFQDGIDIGVTDLIAYGRDF